MQKSRPIIKQSPLDEILLTIETTDDLEVISDLIDRLNSMRADSDIYHNKKGGDFILPNTEIEKVREIGTVAIRKFITAVNSAEKYQSFSTDLPNDVINAMLGFGVAEDTIKAIANDDATIQMLENKSGNAPYFISIIDNYFSQEEVMQKNLGDALSKMLDAHVKYMQHTYSAPSASYDEADFQPIEVFELFLTDNAKTRLGNFVVSNAAYMRDVCAVHLTYNPNPEAKYYNKALNVESTLSQHFITQADQNECARQARTWGTPEIGTDCAKFGTQLIKYAPKDQQEVVAKSYIIGVGYASCLGFEPEQEVLEKFTSALEELNIMPKEQFGANAAYSFPSALA